MSLFPTTVVQSTSTPELEQLRRSRRNYIRAAFHFRLVLYPDLNQFLVYAVNQVENVGKLNLYDHLTAETLTSSAIL